jgi:RNA polymerase sigma factor (sigma-70 family)
MTDDDRGLMERWRGGDEVAGRDLFRRHHDDLRAFVQRRAAQEAEELTQEAIRIALEAVKADKFRAESSFKTFLFGVAKNLLLEHWRRQVRENAPVDLDDESVASLSTSVGTRLARRQEQEYLRRALALLPPDDRRLLHLRYEKDLTLDELASIFTDVEPATLRSRLHRARAALRRHYERLLDERSP